MRRGLKGLIVASFLSFSPFSVHPGLAQSPWADCAAKTSDRIIAGCTRILAGGSKTPVRERVLAYINRGIAYYDRGELDRALADYTSAIRLDPKNAEALSNRADLKLRKGDIESAIEDYSAAIEINPKLAGAFNGRGNALRETGQIDRAISDYEKAIELDPDSPFAYNGRGNALRDKGQADRAIEDFNKAIRIDPSYGTAFIGRANVFSDKGDWVEAIKDYDAALDLDPKDITALNNRGTAYQNMGSLDSAIRDYTAAVALDGRRAALYFNRALAYHAKGDTQNAFEDYTSTIQRDPNYAYAYYNRGQIAQNKGDLRQAIADYDKAIQINPNYAQSYVSRGVARLRQGDARKALEDLRNGLRLDERQVSAYIALGEAYVKLKMFDQAQNELNRALVIDPASAEVLYQRGVVFEAQGKPELAVKDFDSAISLDPEHQMARGARLAAAQRLLAPAKAAVIVAEPQGRLNRVALIIGNAGYKNVSRLPNPPSDAKAVAQTFQSIGFRKVVLVEDQGRESLISELRRFRELADSADWAVIYYAGHGMEIDGTNYVVPVDARLLADRDVPDEAISLSRFLDAVDGAKQLKLIILDACRDNPFLSKMKMSVASRSISRGLARIEPEGSTLVAYAAKNGQLAMDGKGANSPFVTALVSRMLTPGLEIRKVFGLVRDDVLAATRRQQEPSIYGSLGGDDYIINPD